MREWFRRQAAPRDPKLHLVMAGPDSAWCTELRQFAARLGIAPQVTWTGGLFDDLKWGALRSAGLIGEWLRAPDSERAAMRQNAARCFRERYEVHHAVSRLLETLEDCGVRNPVRAMEPAVAS